MFWYKYIIQYSNFVFLLKKFLCYYLLFFSYYYLIPLVLGEIFQYIIPELELLYSFIVYFFVITIYGLYLLCTMYRNSESSTSSGLTYFLLGGLSSCFILLGIGLIYANSGTTYLDNFYIITNLSNIINEEQNNIIY